MNDDNIIFNESISTNEDKLLTTEETAKILGLNPGTLSVWRSTGRYDLPFVKIGRHVKYLESDIYAFIEARKALHTSLYKVDSQN
jgi:predicted DNA-binding transcriptional regulator AlpA